jgi:hypothetical protein
MEAWKVWFAILNNTANGLCQFRLVAFLHYWQQFCSGDAKKPDKFELAGEKEASVRLIPRIRGRLTFATCFRRTFGSP